MTDVLKLIAADRTVRLLPDPKTAEDLRKLDDFWSDAREVGPEQDLTVVSDEDLRAALAAHGIDADMPDAVRAAVQGSRRVPLAPLAACLIGAIAIGSLWWQVQPAEHITGSPGSRSEALDVYVLARPDRPAASAGATEPQGAESRSGLQAATAQSPAGDSDDLTRAEVHEMQHLLARLGYGPLVQDGLPSKALDDAMARFRIDQGLNPQGMRPREGLVMLRLAARLEALRALRDDLSDQ